MRHDGKWPHTHSHCISLKTHRGLKTAATPSHITEIHSGVFWMEEPGGLGWKLKEQFMDFCRVFSMGEEIKTEFTFFNCSFDSCEETLSDDANDPFSSQRPKLVCAAFHWLHVSVGRRGFQLRVDAGVAAPLTASTEGSFWFKAKRKELRLLGS